MSGAEPLSPEAAGLSRVIDSVVENISDASLDELAAWTREGMTGNPLAEIVISLRRIRRKTLEIQRIDVRTLNDLPINDSETLSTALNRLLEHHQEVRAVITSASSNPRADSSRIKRAAAEIAEREREITSAAWPVRVNRLLEILTEESSLPQQEETARDILSRMTADEAAARDVLEGMRGVASSTAANALEHHHEEARKRHRRTSAVWGSSAAIATTFSAVTLLQSAAQSSSPSIQDWWQIHAPYTILAALAGTLAAVSLRRFTSHQRLMIYHGSVVTVLRTFRILIASVEAGTTRDQIVQMMAIGALSPTMPDSESQKGGLTEHLSSFPFPMRH